MTLADANDNRSDEGEKSCTLDATGCGCKQTRVDVTVSEASVERRRFGATLPHETTAHSLTISTSAATTAPIISSRALNQIPAEITDDPELQHAASLLPTNYKFEVFKSVWQIRRWGARRVALQMPEGLLVFSTLLARIFERFGGEGGAGCEVVVLGDVTYGACCVDDYTAKALGCDFMIHYGHSCLVPVTQTQVRTLYVFVEIVLDEEHVEMLLRRYLVDKQFDREEEDALGLDTISRIRTMQCVALVSTVQFISTVHVLKSRLSTATMQFVIPQSRPLSPGEILGCTAPQLPASVDGIVYVGDGRFHLEAIMIANPQLRGRYFRYDPYAKRLSLEDYNHATMHERRLAAIATARSARTFGLILGTLGRQGSPAVLADLERKLRLRGKSFLTILMSEIKPAKLAQFRGVDVWVQVACPRLSIDWSSSFDRPILTPYELNVALEELAWQAIYPMDFYARESLGPWTPNHAPTVRRNGA